MFEKLEQDEELKKFYREGTFLDDTINKSALNNGLEAPCCFKADILLRRALTVARGRLLTVTNKEHDETFNLIEEYLKEKYPEGNWGI